MIITKLEIMRKIFFIFIAVILYNNYIYSQSRVDIINYDINLDVTDMTNKMIKGHCLITCSPLNTTDNFVFDLQNLTIDSIICNENVSLNYTYNDTLLNISTSQMYNANDTIYFDIYYHGSPQQDPSGWGGFYYIDSYAFNMGAAFDDTPHSYGRIWFPCNDNFFDKATCRTTITTQSNHTAVCAGELINITTNTENNTKTYKWYIDKPISTYLVSVAVGNYKHIRKFYQGINDLIPVDYYVYPTDSAKAVASFANIDTVLRLFETKFGAYPWNRVGYVQVPFRNGAMEHVTNIAMGDYFINGNLSYEDLFYHELSHMWFGNAITCSTAEDMWLNEGWATYCETLFREFIKGKKNALNFRRSAHEKVLRYYNIEDNGFRALYPMSQDYTYSSTVYQKGASVVHALRGYLGDETFFETIKNFINHYKYKPVSSIEMRDFITSHTGIDMYNFFNNWVFNPGFVHYSIDSTTCSLVNNNYDATVYIKQRLRGTDVIYNSNKVEVTFMDSAYNTITKLVEFDGEHGSNTFTLPFCPKFVFCDYFEKTSDATIDETKFIKAAGLINFNYTYFAARLNTFASTDSLLFRVTHNFVAPDAFKQPIPGLVLANHRFWTLEGNFEKAGKVKGEFTYNNATTTIGYLDNLFITNSLDSIVLVYRKDRASDWQIVEALNQKVVKKIIVDSIVAGEYALAIKNWNQYHSIENQIADSENNDFKLYPNPATDYITIDFLKCFTGIVSIFDLRAKKIQDYSYTNKIGAVNINCSNLKAGTYIVKVYNTNNKHIQTKELIIQK